jgi:hypothetical protein
MFFQEQNRAKAKKGTKRQSGLKPLPTTKG